MKFLDINWLEIILIHYTLKIYFFTILYTKKCIQLKKNVGYKKYPSNLFEFYISFDFDLCTIKFVALFEFFYQRFNNKDD